MAGKSCVTIVLAGALSATPAVADVMSEGRALYQRLSNEEQCPNAIAPSFEFARQADFAGLSAELKGQFLGVLAGCALSAENFAAADEAIGLADAAGLPWVATARVHVALAQENKAGALTLFEGVAASGGEALSQTPPSVLRQLFDAAAELDPSGARELALHDLIERVGYQSPPAEHLDGFTVRHARLLLGAGQRARAIAKLSEVADLRTMVEIEAGRDFDVLRGDSAFERVIDPHRVAERTLARARADMRAHPRLLRPTMVAAQTLRALGRSNEALELMQPILRRAQAADGAQAFDDHGEVLNWLLNEEAYALQDLGRFDDARVAFRFSVMARESGEQSVSQAINYAVFLESIGEPREALETLREVGRASPYGDMWVEYVRVCANDQLGSIPARDGSLAFMRAHHSDNPAAFTAALLCTNDIDAAAGAMIRRLGGEARDRRIALLALQIYRRHDTEHPRTRMIRDRAAMLRDRADVRAALEPVGRIAEIPLYSSYWGDY